MEETTAGSNEAPEEYHILQRNLRARKKLRELADAEPPVCTCIPLSTGGGSCRPDSLCLNRLSRIECNPASCPCGTECQNQVMQRQRVPQTRCVHMGDKGWGVVAAEDIPPGAFVMEYLGEVIDLDEAEVRARQYEEEGLQHTYVMTLSSGEVIDATLKGGPARFINHSCAPNCGTEKWMVGGELCVGIFARRRLRIPAGAEITYDYRLAWNGGKRVRCCCGAATCLGFLGAHAKSFREALEKEAAGRKVWADQDGLNYALDPALDTFDSEDEAAMRAALDSSNVSRSGPAAGRERSVQEGLGGSSRPAKAAKKRRDRGGKGSSSAKKARQGSPEGSTSAGVADELELDTEFVVGGPAREDGCTSSAAAGGWDACAASRLRLLARMQAHESLQASRRFREADAAEGRAQAACKSTVLQPSMQAVDEMLRVFEAAHAKLSRFVEAAINED